MIHPSQLLWLCDQQQVKLAEASFIHINKHTSLGKSEQGDTRK